MRIFFFISFLLLSLSSIAQKHAELYLMDGSRKVVDIVRQRRDMVIYADTNDYKPQIAYASQIRMLRIADGSYYTYNGERLRLDSLDRGDDYSPLMLAVDWMSPMTGRGTFWAQYNLPGGLFAVRIPYSMGFRGDFANPKMVEWETGLNAMIFPRGHGEWSYFTGIGYRMGRDREILKVQCLGGDCLDKEVYSTFWGLYGLNGVIYTPFKHVAFSGSAGIGIRSSPLHDTDLNLIAELSVVYHFDLPDF